MVGRRLQLLMHGRLLLLHVKNQNLLVRQLLLEILFFVNDLIELADLCLHLQIRLHKRLDLDVFLNTAVVQLVPLSLEVREVFSYALREFLILRPKGAGVSFNVLDLSGQNGSLALFFLQN